VLGHYVSAAAVLCLLALVPGPDVAVVTRSAVRQGRRAGFEAAAGVVGGLAVWALLAVAGLAALLAASATAYNVVRLAGAGYLLALGITQLWRSRAGNSERDADSHSDRSAWKAGALTNLLNPKVAVIYTSLLPSLVPRTGATTGWLGLLALTHITLSLLILLAYASAAGAFRRARSGPRGRSTLQRVTGVTLIGLGIRVAAQR
jgi:threonine/homoserine/homoserine lactone efflux protein